MKRIINRYYLQCLLGVVCRHYKMEHIGKMGNAVQLGPGLGGVGPNWKQFRSAHVLSQFAPRSVELGAGPKWEQLV